MRVLALPSLLLLSACYVDDPIPFLPLDAGAEASTGGAGGTGGTGGGTGGSAPECTSDAACDDGNPCTNDRCAAGSCAHDPAQQGTVCGDATNLCNGASACDGNGACVVGPPIPVDDGNACTVDACDPASGVVTHTPAPGCVTPTALTNAPSARRLHTAVWTGNRMIVWGGLGAGSPAVTASGGRYDPAADAWTATATNGAPPPRHSHCAVWTGDRMIVWGGFGATGPEATGGIYDPATDSWTAMATAGAPPGRTAPACVWTGKELVVWGGTAGGAVLYSGGRYDPAAGTWKTLPIAGTPSPRYGHTGVWTGSRMIIWGGNDLFDWHNDGVSYDPVSDAWTGPTPSAGAPVAREAHTALWTGARMLVWGGFTGGAYLNEGGALDPAGGAWTALSTTSAPSPRQEHAAVWTGNRMMIWGGCGKDSCVELYGDGGVWAPDAGGGAWTPIAASPNVAARRGAAAVWTGSAMVVWGGRLKSGETNTGAQIVP